MRGYYFITDAGLSRAGNIADVRCAAAEGAPIVQYRAKNLETRVLYDEALVLKGLCGDTRFIINDRLDIALAVDADGVHVGQEDMPYKQARRLLGPRKIIGVTVHDVEEAVAAEKMGADYVGVSPVFATGTKPDAGKPCGAEVVRQIREAISIPIAAIGGIDLNNAPDVIAAGADMVCAISAVVASDDVRAAIRKFQRLFE